MDTQSSTGEDRDCTAAVEPFLAGLDGSIAKRLKTINSGLADTIALNSSAK